MIVVVGIPAWQPEAGKPSQGRAAGACGEIARAAVAAGAPVELVGKVGEDTEGDLLVIDLGRSGIGHAALLRDASAPTRLLAGEPAADTGDVTDVDPGALVSMEVDPAEVARSNGHAGTAIPAPTRLVLEPADLELAFRYLVDYRVIVAADELDPPALRVVADAAAFGGASLVAVADAASVSGLPADATVFEPPREDPDGEFARLVGEYAAALDRGEPPESAFRNATAVQGWEPADQGQP